MARARGVAQGKARAARWGVELDDLWRQGKGKSEEILKGSKGR